MGLGFAFLVLATLATIATTAVAWILRSVLVRLTWQMGQGEYHRWQRNGLILPYATLVYFLAAFLLYGIGSVVFLHRDFPIGDSGFVSLVNGYYLQFADETSFVYDSHSPRFADGIFPDGPTQDPEIEPDVRKLQVSGAFILGSTTQGFFLMNTSQHSKHEWPAMKSLQADAAQNGVAVHLESSDTIYNRLRYTRVDSVYWLTVLFLAIAAWFLTWESFIDARLRTIVQ